MSINFDILSHKDAQQISSVIETLYQNGFDYLQLELGDMKLTIGRGNLPTVGITPAAAASPIAATVASTITSDSAAVAPAVAASAPAIKQAATQDDVTVAVVATTMGRFYGKPDPSAAPFVAVGDKVSEEAPVGLIEVMKLFNTVCAGVNGIVTEICVEDAQYVEFGQVLIRIRPTEAKSDTAKEG